MSQTLIALVLFLFPLAYSPGPGNLFFAANGARFGFRSTLRATAGYHLATWAVTALIGFGLLGALELVPGAFRALQLAGAGYVLWIAWRMLRAGVLEQGGKARPASFMDGVILLLLNPKAYVIITLMFTQFLTPSAVNHVVLVLLITTIFTLNNLIAFSLWTLAGDRLAALFAQDSSARRLNLLFGGMLAAVAVWMALA
ncbi:LysE family translocator [uncultured Roseovarius sp.]|uniref:LysE family translocator n=1 Tax=uncultured Roseovarius sp. TaxID=293344 RepID=UPI0025ECDC64|nr:LysE family translocator [uncultured Roseovarius sp.]